MLRTAAIALLLAACGGDASDRVYDCQPICQYPNGTVLGSSKDDYTIDAVAQFDAEDQCKMRADDDGDRCDAGGTVMRCSCDELPSAD